MGDDDRRPVWAASQSPSQSSHPDSSQGSSEQREKDVAASPTPYPPCSAQGLTIAVGPVIIQPVPHLLVDGGHGLHVALPPLPSQVLGLHLEQLQHVELHHGLLHLQSPLQDGG